MRRRRRRRRRGGRGGGAEASGSQHSLAQAATPDWQWRTFPVFFALAVGALAMGLLTALAPAAFPVFLIAAFFATAFGAAHVVSRRWRAARRRR